MNPPYAPIPKDPSAVLDYGIDLAPSVNATRSWLAKDEIVTDLVVTADSGITVDSQSIDTNSTGVAGSLLVAWLSGGALGAFYKVRFEFTTSEGRTDTRTLVVRMTAR